MLREHFVQARQHRLGRQIGPAAVYNREHDARGTLRAEIPHELERAGAREINNDRALAAPELVDRLRQRVDPDNRQLRRREAFFGGLTLDRGASHIQDGLVLRRAGFENVG
ncbi:MAG: hypothetical protein DMF96_31530 [Acidobacteria bacterium]|nr:MAG: hypothetical protein DMF96_31530 [Acidobacteriota bacterium]